MPVKTHEISRGDVIFNDRYNIIGVATGRKHGEMIVCMKLDGHTEQWFPGHCRLADEGEKIALHVLTTGREYVRGSRVQ